MSDEQTGIFSCYHGMNDFIYCMLNHDEVNETIRESPEILSNLEEFSKKALKHLDEYDIPKLRVELLGHHINNL